MLYIVNFKSNNDFDKEVFIEDLNKRYKPIALKIEDKKGHKILWLVDRVNLLEQSVGKFNEYKLENDISYQLICTNANSTLEMSRVAEINLDTQILFASVSSITAVAEIESSEFAKWIAASQEDDKKLYIIYDEVHNIGANEIRKFFGSLFTR